MERPSAEAVAAAAATSPSPGGGSTSYDLSLMTSVKPPGPRSSDCTDVVEATRTPAGVRTTARSMPASSRLSMSRKSPTVCVTGLRVKTHGSSRDGSGTVTCGSPCSIATVTTSSALPGMALAAGGVVGAAVEAVLPEGGSVEKLLHGMNEDANDAGGSSIGGGAAAGKRNGTSECRCLQDQMGTAEALLKASSRLSLSPNIALMLDFLRCLAWD